MGGQDKTQGSHKALHNKTPRILIESRESFRLSFSSERPSQPAGHSSRSHRNMPHITVNITEQQEQRLRAEQRKSGAPVSAQVRRALDAAVKPRRKESQQPTFEGQ